MMEPIYQYMFLYGSGDQKLEIPEILALMESGSIYSEYNQFQIENNYRMHFLFQLERFSQNLHLDAVEKYSCQLLQSENPICPKIQRVILVCLVII